MIKNLQKGIFMILGIELGSTRIKSVFISEQGETLASGAYEWENDFVDGYWTYSLDDALLGLRESYKSLKRNYKGEICVDAIGISGMMHGYLPFDENNNLLTPFRTWRNSNATDAARELSDAFDFNMPARWSATQFYHAVINKEPHVKNIAFMTTLAGYIHFRLTGKKVIGIGEGSGMFPIKGNGYDKEKIETFNRLLSEHGVDKDFSTLLPEILLAGEAAGCLTEEGARLLDEEGSLKAGTVLCPPEGDGPTGMVATNTLKETVANVSAGTSVFLTVVLEKPLSKRYEQIDMLTTPTGKSVAVLQCSNCTGEINAWVNLLYDAALLGGATLSKGEMFERLFKTALESDCDLGNLYACNYLSGEHTVNLPYGVPFVARTANSKMSLANFMQTEIYSSLVTLSENMHIFKNEGVKISTLYGHGGFFKTENVGQRAMSAALGYPVTVMDTSGEGGAYGIALLALYLKNNSQPLNAFVDKIYAANKCTTLLATKDDIQRFNCFKEKFKSTVEADRLLASLLK